MQNSNISTLIKKVQNPIQKLNLNDDYIYSQRLLELQQKRCLKLFIKLFIRFGEKQLPDQFIQFPLCKLTSDCSLFNLQRISNLIFIIKIFPPHMQQLWVDKFRPRTFEDLSFHSDLSKVLSQLAQTSDFPHMIFYGPEGAGKKTRAYAFLQKIFGKHIYKLKSEDRVLKPENTSISVQFTIYQSNYHIQITPSDNQHHDTHIIQNIVKQIASSQNMDVSKNAKSFKILIIHEAERLTKQAQGALRRTMQMYMKNCRMILICSKIHKLIPPIRSRCVNIRVPAPSNQEIFEVCSKVASKMSSSLNLNFTEQTIKSVVQHCDRNLRLALIILQATKYSKNSQALIAPYKKQIKQISNMIFKEQSSQQLKKIRDKYYDLLVNCIDGSTILKQLLQCMMQWEGLQEEFIKNIIQHAAQHEKTLNAGSKAIFHLEAFAAHVMEELIESKSKNYI